MFHFRVSENRQNYLWLFQPPITLILMYPCVFLVQATKDIPAFPEHP